jgi:hypothetical protein
METINNLASKAANVVAGKNNTTGTYENVTRSMPENDSIGGSSKPNYEVIIKSFLNSTSNI